MHLIDRIIHQTTRPVPLRTLFLRWLLRNWPIGSFEARLRAGGVLRPHYGWCMYYAAVEAKALGFSAVTVAELGVANGYGLLCLCQHKKEIEKELGIEIVLVGFDAGNGLPASDDPRDLLYYWAAGAFEMNEAVLKDRLDGRAQLVLGDVAETCPAWSPRPDAPLGAALFDLDLYTSTAAGLALLTKQDSLPRIWCYFDDICGAARGAITDSIGEREAIKQFNLRPEREMLRDHLSQAFAFKNLVPESWHQQIFLYHRLNHPLYNANVYEEGEKPNSPL